MSTSDLDLDAVTRHYEESLDVHGPTPRGVGWNEDSDHRLRFAVFAELLRHPVPEDPITVNDLGCGYGRLFDYLERETPVELRRYHGYDISASMVEEARSRLPSDRAEVHPGDRVSEEADYTFASGIFNVRLDSSREAWEHYVRATLREMAEQSRRGMAFNSLTAYVDWKEDHLYYADPAEYLSFCQRELAPDVRLLHDYPLYEWTLVVRF